MTTRDAKNFRRLGIAALAALLLSSCSAEIGRAHV